MIKNIVNLTKIFFKDSFQNPYIIDKKTNRINKKSIFVWLIIVVMIAISYMSTKIIDLVISINKPTIFLNVFFLILNIIMIFQVILASINVYFNSKDIELILPLPIKSEDLLISKFNTILINMYFSELVFAVFPLIIYGISTFAGILYYIYLLLVLLLFPILTILVVSIIMMFFMKLSKFIKNKDIFQVIITFIFIFIVLILEFKIVSNIMNKTGGEISLENKEIIQAISDFDNRLENVNKYFLVINPIVKILNNYNKLNAIFELIKILFIDAIFLIFFILIGKKYYIKNILNNTNYKYYKKEDINKLEKGIKRLNISKSYVKKEFKTLFKNPIFFIQCIFPTIILAVSLAILTLVVLPNLQSILDLGLFGENFELKVDLSVICLILAVIQMIFTLSNISISAISRDGRNAMYMKFIPVDLYKQFIYKTIPQIFINMILILLIIIFIKLVFPIFDLINLLSLFIIANLFNILNSTLMVLADLYRPNINWKAEYEAVKSNNKLFQYGLTIFIILLLVYFNKILSGINIYNANLIIIVTLIIIILLINIFIKLNINKLFKKIN